MPLPMRVFPSRTSMAWFRSIGSGRIRPIPSSWPQRWESRTAIFQISARWEALGVAARSPRSARRGPSGGCGSRRRGRASVGRSHAACGFVAVVMGIGAVFGAMNTMYAIVAARTRDPMRSVPARNLSSRTPASRAVTVQCVIQIRIVDHGDTQAPRAAGDACARSRLLKSCTGTRPGSGERRWRWAQWSRGGSRPGP